MADIEDSSCPSCNAPAGSLSLTSKLEAKPIGSFSLAGVMTKFPVREVAHLDCSTCGLHLVGHFVAGGVEFP
jgi:hypothetical protein